MKDRAARILVVDDEAHICVLLCRWLTAENYECATASDGDAALKLLSVQEFDLVISDIMMPGMSGVDLLTAIKAIFKDVAVVMVTGVDDRNTAILTLQIGAYGYIIKPFDKNEIIISVSNALERRRLKLLSEEYERSLEQKVEQRTREVKLREEEIIFRLVSALGSRHQETGAHVKRIGIYAAEMARSLGWEREKQDQIRLAAPMHDVGKIGIPDNILLKPGKLTTEEYEIIKRHAEMGAQILYGSAVPMLEMGREIALCHHERWSGSGYPNGLAGDAIPECARIVCVVDVYDSLTHNRVYRPAFSELKAFSMMNALKNEVFDPTIFDCFVELLPSLRRLGEEVREEGVPVANGMDPDTDYTVRR